MVAAAQDGDRGALEKLLRSNYDRLFAICRRLTGNDADAADATQEALISLVRGLPRFDCRSRFATWAYRIAVNAALDELRRRGRRAEPGLDEERLQVGHAVYPVRPEEAETSAERVDVDAALRRLPVEFRAPVVLRDLCGLDYAEIAEVLDIPSGTVRSRIARGRAALVPLLGGPGGLGGNRPALVDRPNEES
ncbi:MAG TPA: sigma-70 family RNA polymerase sigma factor [Acidimicrobiales bacterium]|nr:sigma-70 family RNA polymerase sigma factor [Acidimicrobiales bacterium]